MIILYIALSLLQILDYISTTRLIETGLAVEGNPLVKALIDKIGLHPALILLKVIVIMIFPLHYHFFGYNDYVSVAMFALCVFYTAVVVNNFRLFKE